MQGLGVRQDHDHLLGALGEGALDGLGHMDFLRPLLGANGVAMQGVDHGIAAAFVAGIARRQKDQHLAVDGVAFQVALQCGAVNLDVLHRYRLGAGHYRRHFSLSLCQSRPGAERISARAITSAPKAFLLIVNHPPGFQYNPGTPSPVILPLQ